MAIDTTAVGRRLAPVQAIVTAERLRFFANVTGETRPEYLDADAARAAGHRAIPAPPTFAFTLQLIASDTPLAYLTDLGVDLSRVLHGEQSFAYSGEICAGDEIRLDSVIVDIAEKKGGALIFITDETAATNQHGETVAIIRRTCVVRA